MPAPNIDRSVTLQFIGDWGQANFHRICGWLTQEFCDRAGPRSRVGIWNWRDGGLESLQQVQDGEVDLCVTTPAMLAPQALSGEGLFAGKAMPDLRALGVLPQNDRMVLALDPKFGVSSFAELRDKKPPLRIATSVDDGTNFIGYVAARYMEAHGVDQATLESWGGGYVTRTRPEQSLFLMADGEADAVLQEAIMTPWWARVMDERRAVVLGGEPDALARLERDHGFIRSGLPAGYWPTLTTPIETTDFSDFLIVVRRDMPDDVAHLLAWCLVETRENLERQYRHLAPAKSPLSYPLVPATMARTSIPLHAAAQAYYEAAGHLPRP